LCALCEFGWLLKEFESSFEYNELVDI
jgi:hypothetical protein